MAEMAIPRKNNSARDLGLMLVVWSGTAIIIAAFIWIIGDFIIHGFDRLSWPFLTTSPTNAGRAGGIAPILVSTLLILLIAIAVALPIGVATAAFLTEFTRVGGRVRQVTTLSLDILAGVPSIVFGLFGNAFFCIWLGLGFSILSGGLTLACMVLPILIRTTQAGLSSVPDEWRRGASALGLSRGAALTHILLPAATPAIAAGLMLGIGRAAAETAALIFTSGYVDRMPSSLDDSGRALAVHIYDLTMNVAGGDTNAYASALVLISLLILINSVAVALINRYGSQRITAS
jgi:phosphate transport system permease protein